jgi:hypothetical protein
LHEDTLDDFLKILPFADDGLYPSSLTFPIVTPTHLHISSISSFPSSFEILIRILLHASASAKAS